MCGIYGEIVVAASEERRLRFGRTAARALHHRGPDGEGEVVDDHALLGHLRLAILDLSDRAAQPMVAASGQSVIAFNGEVYNFVEWRRTVRAPPGGFRSEADTEVLLEALDERGPGAIVEAVGMFALALWRPAERELWLIRDRLGKKPLYYARTPDGALRFASELGALLADGVVPRETTPDRLAEYLQLGYVAGPSTGLTTVHQVPPGCWLRARITATGIETELHRYWDLPRPEDAPRFPDADAFREAFASTLRDAVRIRLRSDVPLGAFLSGGIDSSVVGLLAARELPSKLRTFTVDFEEAGWSEGPFAAEVAARIGSAHTELRLRSDALESIPELVATYGDLHGDSSALPTLALCKEARRHVTVALAGDGGDELLGGYGRYGVALRTTAIAARIPRAALAVARALAKRRPLAWMRGSTRLARLHQDADAFYALEMRAHLQDPWPSTLRRPPHHAWPDPLANALIAQRGRPPLLRMMGCDVKTYLAEDILVKVDRASMAFGLEVRAPLLDHRLMELSMGAEPEWLAGPEGGKRPLRELYGPSLPTAVFDRPKMGFGVPIARWLRQSVDHTELLLDRAAAVAPVLDRGGVRRMIASHRMGLQDESARLWRLLCLRAWFELWRPTVRDA